MWATRPHLANIFEKLLDQKTFHCLRLVFCSHYQINLPLWMRLQKEDEIQPMLNQLKNRYRQWQYRRICRTLQLPPQLIQDLPTLANQTQQSGAAVQQLQTTMQQTLSRLQQDDLTTLSLLERVTKLERAARGRWAQCP